MSQKKHDLKVFSSDADNFLCRIDFRSIILCWVLFLCMFCMVRCGRPVVFMSLCKPHTIEDHALRHATVRCKQHKSTTH